MLNLLKTNNTWWYAAVSLGVLLQLLAFAIPLFDDAALMGVAASIFQENSAAALLTYPHPPLGFLFYFLSTSLLGVSVFSLRLVSLAFNFLTFIVLYKFAKVLYNEKAARTAVLLLLFTFYPFYTGLIVDVDGSMMTFFGSLLFFSLYKFLNQPQNKKWLVLALLASGIFFNIKLRLLIFFLSVVVFIYLITKSQRQTAKYSLYVLLSVLFFGAISFLIIQQISAELFKEQLARIILHSGQASYALFSKIQQPLKFLNLAVALTPFYILLVFTRLFHRVKRDALLFSWLIPPSVVYLLTIPIELAASYPRFFSVIYPPMILLSSALINDLVEKNKRNNNVLGKLFLVFCFLGMLVLSMIVNGLANDHWYFVSADSSVIKVFQPLLVFYLLLPIIAFGSYCIFKKLNLSKWAQLSFSTFVAVSLAFNLFLILDPAIDSTHRNLIKDIKDFSKSQEFVLPVYSLNEDVPFYANKNNAPILHLNNPDFLKELIKRNNVTGLNYLDLDTDDATVKKYVDTLGGTVILLNYPSKYVPPVTKERIKYFSQRCTRINKKEYKTADLLFFTCQKAKQTQIKQVQYEG